MIPLKITSKQTLKEMDKRTNEFGLSQNKINNKGKIISDVNQKDTNKNIVRINNEINNDMEKKNVSEKFNSNISHEENQCETKMPADKNEIKELSIEINNNDKSKVNEEEGEVTEIKIIKDEIVLDTNVNIEDFNKKITAVKVTENKNIPENTKMKFLTIPIINKKTNSNINININNNDINYNNSLENSTLDLIKTTPNSQYSGSSETDSTADLTPSPTTGGPISSITVTQSPSKLPSNSSQNLLQKKLVTNQVMGLYGKLEHTGKRLKAILKESPLVSFGLVKKRIPSQEDIVEESKLLLEDYIFIRLKELIATEERLEDYHARHFADLSEVSKEIHILGLKLETNYPKLFLKHSISSMVNMAPIKNEFMARKVLVSIGDYLFKHETKITWARIIAFFAVTGALAIECFKSDRQKQGVSQNRLGGGVPDTGGDAMNDVVKNGVLGNIFSEVVEKHLAEWIALKGGWGDITKAYRAINQETRFLWALTFIGTSIGFAVSWVSIQQI